MKKITNKAVKRWFPVLEHYNNMGAIKKSEYEKFAKLLETNEEKLVEIKFVDERMKFLDDLARQVKYIN